VPISIELFNFFIAFFPIGASVALINGISLGGEKIALVLYFPA
jgi:hypothetical protein